MQSQTEKKSTNNIEEIIHTIENKDIETVEKVLQTMLVCIRGFDIDKCHPKHQKTWYSKFLGTTKPMEKLIQKYQKVNHEITQLSKELEKSRTTLLTQSITLERVYQKHLSHMETLKIDEENKKHILVLDKTMAQIQEDTQLCVKKLIAIRVNAIILWEKQLTQAIEGCNHYDASATAYIELEKYIESMKQYNHTFIQTLEDILEITKEVKNTRHNVLEELNQKVL